MWLLCCGMNRSGSTLHYHIAVKLTAIYGSSRALGFFGPGMFEQVVDLDSTGDSDWSIIKLHDYSDEVDVFWNQVHPKALYIYRDIRDVVVSLMHMQGWAFESLEIENSVRSAIRNFEYWTGKPGILVSRYEDVMREGGVLQEVHKVARYLGIQVSAKEAAEIAASVDLPEQKRHIQTFDYDTKGVAVGNTRFDPESLLHNRHIHSGEIGQWRTALSVQQIAIIEWWAGTWLQECGYTLLTNEIERNEQLGIFIRLKQQLDVSEADRAARLVVINDLRQHLDASEADRAARLVVIDDLKRRLDAIEAGRGARRSPSDDFNQRLDASEAERQTSEKIIGELREQLDASEAERRAGQAVIEDLKQHLEASEADRAARQDVIDSLLLQIDELMLQLRNRQSGN